MSSNHVAAVFVPRKPAGQDIANRLRAEGVEALQVHSSEELHRCLNTQRIDALLIEQQLNGFLTGLEILTRLREELLRPVTVLVGETTAAERQTAARLRVDFVFPWDEGLDAICAAVLAALRSAGRTTLNIPAAAREKVARAEYIKPMPQLVVQVMRYLHDDSACVADLAKDISVDARVTAELLRHINSAAFGLQTRVEKVADAVAFLGIRATAALILSMSVHRTRGSWDHALPTDVTRWFATRSVMMASVASAFARHLSDVSADTAYVLALLQDLGILVLANDPGESYLRLLTRVRSVAQLQLHGCERQELSFTHADVSAALMQKWELPASLTRLVLDHHAERVQASATEAKFLHLARLGEAVANMRDVPSPQRHRHFQRLLAEYDETRHIDVKACFAAAVDKAAQAMKLFDVPVPDQQEWNQLLQQMAGELKAPASAAVAADDWDVAPDPPESSRPSEEPAGPPTLLVIDDEQPIGRIVQLFLKNAAVQVEYRQTVPNVADVGPHIVGVLCDVHMGQTSGIEFVRRLRDAGFTRPVLMISGDRTRHTVVDSVEAGINDFLVKPFNKQMMIEKFVKHGLLGAPTPQPTAPTA